MTAIKTQDVIAKARQMQVADGQALYLVGDDVILGKDGCQPSNSLCLVVGPTDDTNWSDVADSVDEWVAARH